MGSESMTVLCGSLSRHPVSLGAAMHRAAYAELGLDYVYVPFECRDLAGALAGMRAMGIRGFGVSMPFKQEVLALLDEVDPLAERIGAVNTVVNDGSRLRGHNTDATGAVHALEEAASVQGRRVCVIGAGGAARAVSHGLKDAGARVHIANRTAERATELASALPDATGGGLGELDVQAFDVVVNASSAGMAEYGREPAFAASRLRPGQIVMDIVYDPIKTALLSQAAEAGARTIHGGRMLLHQACRQFELYTGRQAPLRVMNEALEEQLRLNE